MNIRRRSLLSGAGAVLRGGAVYATSRPWRGGSFGPHQVRGFVKRCCGLNLYFKMESLFARGNQVSGSRRGSVVAV